ncbi:uncharacterized protein LOC121529830 [Drosophila eugracilis]|uniref:uncharacterized protein LOC121529830 n=1 Tax=Drosophila eugracilis TaxID=29029 RepID=UPI001BD94B48|nr:uncharacterized protein LOC121529830 [Drosophila eugracilis]
MYNGSKNNTTKAEFQTRFRCLHEKLGTKSWLYTDGSKTDDDTTFAVVDSNDKIISGGMQPPYNSIFTEEAFAILQACLFATKYSGHFVICTDSLSTLSFLQNWGQTDPTIVEIRRLSSFNNITLVWTPSHQAGMFNIHPPSYRAHPCNTRTYPYWNTTSRLPLRRTPQLMPSSGERQGPDFRPEKTLR